MKRRAKLNIPGFPLRHYVAPAEKNQRIPSIDNIPAGCELEFIGPLADRTKVEVLSGTIHWVIWRSDWDLAEELV